MKQTTSLTPKAQRLWTGFVIDLRDAHIKAGKPPYRPLAGRSGKALHGETKTISFSKTTLSRVLNGSVEPKWDFVVAFLRTLGVHSEVINEMWHPKWASLTAELHRYGSEISEEPQPTPGFTCPICGAWITNQELHDKWHTTNGVTQLPVTQQQRLRLVENTNGRRRTG